MKVFISYAKEDIEIAEKLYHDLKRADISPWMDKEDLLPGTRWEHEIDKAIKESSYFIILLSSKSITKTGGFQVEIKKALENFQRFSPDKLYIIPVRLDKCEPPYQELHALHWADLFPSYQDGLNKILRVLVPDHPQTLKPKQQLRKEPVITDDPVKVFKLNRDWKPLEYIQNDFIDNGDGTISDNVTDLMWQQSGSDNWFPHDKAIAYIEELNCEKFMGYNDWRLPTVDELKSLFTQEKQSNTLYISLVFDSMQWWCWTSDKRLSGGAWGIGFNYAGINWGDGSGYVRAVRSRQ